MRTRWVWHREQSRKEKVPSLSLITVSCLCLRVRHWIVIRRTRLLTVPGTKGYIKYISGLTVTGIFDKRVKEIFTLRVTRKIFRLRSHQLIKVDPWYIWETDFSVILLTTEPRKNPPMFSTSIVWQTTIKNFSHVNTYTIFIIYSWRVSIIN